MHRSLQWLHIDFVVVVVYCTIVVVVLVFLHSYKWRYEWILMLSKQNITHTQRFISDFFLSLRYSPSIEPWICQQPNNKIKIALFKLNKQTPNMLRSTIFLYNSIYMRVFFNSYSCVYEWEKNTRNSPTHTMKMSEWIGSCYACMCACICAYVLFNPLKWTK